MRRRLGLVLAAVLAAGAVTVGVNATAAAAPPGQVQVSATPTPLVAPPDPFLGTMPPAANADTQGMFAPQVDWPLMPIHAAVAPSGRLITYGSPVGQPVQGGLSYDDWAPGRGTAPAAHTQTPTMDRYDSFCNGLQQMPDGRLLMVGGNSTTTSMFFDPTSKAQAMGPALNRQRWYATVLRRPDDRILVIGGGNYYAFGAWRNPNDNSVVATVPEIGTGTGAWQVLGGADSTALFGAQRNRWWYPRAYNAPDGSVFGMSDDRMWRMSTTGNGAITDVGRLPIAPGTSGSSVMYDTGKILVSGGGQAANDDGLPAIRGAAVVDINQATPRVTGAAAMALQRNWHNLTVLANGEVLANGGTVVGTNGGAANSSYRSEIWNPGTGQWRSTASAARIRTYHSTAALLPSGAVFTGGGGAPGPEDNLNAEMFYPPYLFARKTDGSVGWANRGGITSIAGSLTYGGRLTLGMADDRRIASASLIRLSNVTHSVNMDQRRIPLAVTQTGSTVTTTLPTNRNVLTPGSYLLQGVDAAGVPTPSQTVTISGTGAPGTVTVYEGGTTPGGGGGGGTQPGTVGLTPGTAVGLEPTNYLGHRVRHQNAVARMDPLTADSDPAARSDSSFVVRTGLSGEGVSFESVNVPGRFLRADDAGAVRLVARDGSAAFAGRASFLPVTGLGGQGTSFQLSADKQLYLRHQNFALYAQRFDGGDQFRKDSTFRARPALQPLPYTARISLEPVNQKGSLLRHANFVARVDPINAGSAALARADSTFVVRAPLGRGGCASLEAVNYPGYFLRVVNGQVRLERNDGSAAFAQGATFCPTTGLAASGVTLRTVADGPATVQANGATVTVTSFDGSDAQRGRATFTVLPAVG